MNVKKFTANTSREALWMVREELGPDAIILSNRSVNGAIEILALAAEDMDSLSQPQQQSKSQPESERIDKPVISESTLAALAPRRKAASEQELHLSEAMQHLRQTPEEGPPTYPTYESVADVMNEIRSMRGMLEAQLAEIAWGSQHKNQPVKSAVLREMLAAGFSPSLARYLTEKLTSVGTAEEGIGWVKSILERNLTIMNNENEILETGGIYALVGPTGVGKTTTTAKLAARCVARHGPSKLALITTDGYRIGGYEQLRIYGKILGVMVHSVKDESDLRIALDELRGKHIVLIDTVGMSQRDQMVAEQAGMLQAASGKIKRLLCLAATSTGETLNEVARAYEGNGLSGCIMTKLDEAATIGSVLDIVIRHKLNLYYVANGQRVPEDLHIANQHYLVDRAFKLKRETAPFQYRNDELPLVMGNAARAANDKTLSGVILG